jgi:hypothetical protein
VAAAAALLANPGSLLACAGLIGSNGAVNLGRTTTLAGYSDGVEHYVTAFEFQGGGGEFGTLIPLPGVPSKVERGGDWTLQRLQLEVAPPVAPEAAKLATAAAGDAEVLLQTQIDALDITILRGGGDAVGKWAIDHGFLLTPDTPEVLDFYSARSPIFMAARFDASRAAALGQVSGDGTPIMLTIPTDEPWVPLRILGLGLARDEVVQADVFLLTPERPQLLAGASGLTLARSEQASDSLLSDLRSDTGMHWVPSKLWLSYLTVDSRASDLDYDLAISTHDGQRPSSLAAGIDHATLLSGFGGVDDPSWPAGLGIAAVVAGLLAYGLTSRRLHARRSSGAA